MDAKRFLDHLTTGRGYRGQLVFVKEIPARAARYGELAPALPAPLLERLAELGVARLYSHQAEAIAAVRAGRNVVVTTGTASGKTFCYNLPILERTLAAPGTRALYIFPTKALAQDQLRGLGRLTGKGGLLPPGAIGTYDGDTPAHARRKLRDEGRLILTNPDMLHQGILPRHTAWAPFLGSLCYVVIDEIHTYRGVFGANVANVIRRLLRLCRRYGSDPVFICCSATIANPVELAESLTGKEFLLVDEDGSPRGSKQFAFWNPPLLEDGTGERRSANSEAAELLAALAGERTPSIAFCRARVTAELLQRYTADLLGRRHPGLVNRIRAYRGGYLPSERREIERRLFSGELLAVTTTNALELGIDIGSLDACLIVGYPGTIASTWQQAGRAGRGAEEALAVYVAQNTPIDQYLARHPEYFFGRSPETAVVDPDNPHIVLGHLRAAAFEAPLGPEDLRGFGRYAPALLEILAEERQVAKGAGGWYWRGGGFPAGEVSLRNICANTYTIIDIADGGKVIGTMDEASAFQQLHTQAVYLHEGDLYFVREMDLAKKASFVEKADLDYYTQSITEIQVRVEERELEKAWRVSTACFGDVSVMQKPYLFRKIKFGSRDSIGFGQIDLPPQNMSTTALWVVPPAAALRRVRDCGRDPIEGLYGVANVLTEVLPFLVMADPADVGSTVDLNNLGSAALFVYDKYPGGLGLAHKAYDRVEEVFAAALDLLANCPCADGCPSCVGAPIPPQMQLDPDSSGRGRIADKEAALCLLHDLLELPPYTPKPKPVPSAPVPAPPEPLPPVPPPPLVPLPEAVERRIRRQLQDVKQGRFRR
ncbi:MAG: DEAD/DEAH box helicase [Patescibacteria group bacterium]